MPFELSRYAETKHRRSPGGGRGRRDDSRRRRKAGDRDSDDVLSARARSDHQLHGVRGQGPRRLLPACGTPARDGMQVENDCEEVRDARRSALELLLGDHVGDCVGPCRMACPAHMDIPLMIRQIEAGQLKDAIATVKRDIALPAVLGRICPAARRGGLDLPVEAIRRRCGPAIGRDLSTRLRRGTRQARGHYRRGPGRSGGGLLSAPRRNCLYGHR